MHVLRLERGHNGDPHPHDCVQAHVATGMPGQIRRAGITVRSGVSSGGTSEILSRGCQ
jgi:hypothetical protein